MIQSMFRNANIHDRMILVSGFLNPSENSKTSSVGILISTRNLNRKNNIYHLPSTKPPSSVLFDSHDSLPAHTGLRHALHALHRHRAPGLGPEHHRKALGRLLQLQLQRSRPGNVATARVVSGRRIGWEQNGDLRQAKDA